MELLKILCVAIMTAMLLSGCGRARTVDVADMTYPLMEPEQTPVLTEPAVLLEKSPAPPENTIVEELARSFAAAYFAGSQELMEEYLVSDYGSIVPSYPLGQGCLMESIQLPQSVTAELAMKGTCWANIAFRETPGADSYTYLTLELVQEEGDWKIAFYGLEK